MLNYIGIAWVELLVYGPWKGEDGFPYTATFDETWRLPLLFRRVHLGLLLVVLLASLLWWAERHSTLGYELRVAGASLENARYGGIPVLSRLLLLMALVALLIRLDSPGPVIYSQERVGQHGKPFRIYKFRSMVQDAEKMTGPQWAAKNDPRITRVGRWIRKLRIDEIPQFWNVLKGEMSLVGPRPERPYFVEKFKKEIPLYTRRLRVRPGISGWAQIKGAYDSSIDDVKQKLQYDLFYLENMSLRMDLKILLNTVYVILTGRGQ
jgi:lipopolysaccharide/colanic/teichoic acid biosynthesis glycosyltransferase